MEEIRDESKLDEIAGGGVSDKKTQYRYQFTTAAGKLEYTEWKASRAEADKASNLLAAQLVKRGMFPGMAKLETRTVQG